METSSSERRVSGRVEEILHGWWRKDAQQKFQRCRSLDLSLDGALIVVDTLIEQESQISLTLDVEDDWSIELSAQVLWQRPIFFGKQQLTAVSYKFQRPGDRSMFGLWIQRKLASKGLSHTSYVKGGGDSRSEDEALVLPESPKVEFKEDLWRRTLGQLTSKIPWLEGEEVPNDRRREARGQVGLSLRLEFPNRGMPAELLNVSLSGACVFVAEEHVEDSSPVKTLTKWLSGTTRTEGDLVVGDKSLLMGGRRCPVETVWSQPAQELNEGQAGRVFGLRFRGDPEQTRKTFVGDLLRRINYNHKQVRSELRFPARVPVLVDTDRGSQVRGETVDLGAGGACLRMVGELPAPSNGVLHLTLPRGPGQVFQVSLSVRILRQLEDEAGKVCYAAAFRKGQVESHLALSRWLAQRMRVQNLDELVPNLAVPKGNPAEGEEGTPN